MKTEMKQNRQNQESKVGSLRRLTKLTTVRETDQEKREKTKKRRTSEANVENIWVISNLEREYIIILYALLSVYLQIFIISLLKMSFKRHGYIICYLQLEAHLQE